LNHVKAQPVQCIKGKDETKYSVETKSVNGSKTRIGEVGKVKTNSERSKQKYSQGCKGCDCESERNGLGRSLLGYAELVNNFRLGSKRRGLICDFRNGRELNSDRSEFPGNAVINERIANDDFNIISSTTTTERINQIIKRNMSLVSALGMLCYDVNLMFALLVGEFHKCLLYLKILRTSANLKLDKKMLNVLDRDCLSDGSRIFSAELLSITVICLFCGLGNKDSGITNACCT